MNSMTLTLRAIARLLGYPDEALLGHLAELRAVLHDERALTFGRLADIDRLFDRLASQRGLEAESDYVETFDRGRGSSLHLFEHVHGDSRERGPAMIDLIKIYEQAGLYLAPDELPDHLAVLLEYASTQPAQAARDFLREFAHLLQTIFSALDQRGSPYAALLAALLDLAGEKAQARKPVAEAPLDESWAEPPVFGGCSSAGQQQPIRIQRRPPQGARA